jgi:hypothetical protein
MAKRRSIISEKWRRPNRHQLAGLREPVRAAVLATFGREAPGRDMAWIHVGALLDVFASVLELRRPKATWWERLAGLDYVEKGREYVREGFFSCYEQAQAVFDELEDVDKHDKDLELTADDVADVLMVLMTTEVHGLLADGGLLFPHRAGGADYSDQERSFDQLTREAEDLEGCLDRAGAASAAAHAAAVALSNAVAASFDRTEASAPPSEIVEDDVQAAPGMVAATFRHRMGIFSIGHC